MKEEDRDKTLDAIGHLEEFNGLLVRENSPSKDALDFLKRYLKELLSKDTWVEARQAEYAEDLDRCTAPQETITNHDAADYEQTEKEPS